MGCGRIEVHKLMYSPQNKALQLLDAGLYSGHTADPTLHDMPDLPRVSMYDHLDNRYVLVLDGFTNAWRQPFSLASGQAVLSAAGATTRAFYSDTLHPWGNLVTGRPKKGKLDDYRSPSFGAAGICHYAHGL